MEQIKADFDNLSVSGSESPIVRSKPHTSYFPQYEDDDSLLDFKLDSLPMKNIGNITNIRSLNEVLKKHKPLNEYKEYVANISIDNKIEQDCKKLISEMSNTHMLDSSNNFFTTKNSINKIVLLDKLSMKIKNDTFRSHFLEKCGLDHIHNMLKRLSDGSQPPINLRNNAQKILLNLPVKIDHLKNTKLGKTITCIIETKDETPENKNLAKLIKEKWSRVILGVSNLRYNEEARCEPSTYVRKLSNKENKSIVPNLNTRVNNTNHSLLQKKDPKKSANNVQWANSLTGISDYLKKIRKMN